MKPSPETSHDSLLKSHPHADEIKALLAQDTEGPDSIGMTEIPKDVEIERARVAGALRPKSPADEMGDGASEFRYDVEEPLSPDDVNPRNVDSVYATTQTIDEQREKVAALATLRGDAALARVARDGVLSERRIAEILDELEPDEIQDATSRRRERRDENTKRVAEALRTKGYVSFADGPSDDGEKISGSSVRVTEKKGTHRSRRAQAYRFEANA